MVAGEGAALTRLQRSLPASRFSTQYPVMRPPPSLEGFVQVRLTKSPPTSSTSGTPGVPGASEGGDTAPRIECVLNGRSRRLEYVVNVPSRSGHMARVRSQCLVI